MPLKNKETKPNQTKQIVLEITLFSKLENIECICYIISHYDVLFLSSYGYIINIYIYIYIYIRIVKFHMNFRR